MASAITETETYEASVIGPDDGDTRNASSVRVGLEDLANRSKWLKARVDQIAGSVVSSENDAGGLAIPALVAMETVTNTSPFANLTGGLAEKVTVANIKNGDIIWFYATFIARVAAGGDVGHVRIGDSATTTVVEGAYAYVTSTTDTAVCLVGKYVATADAATKDFYLMAAVTAGGDSMTISGPAALHARISRP